MTAAPAGFLADYLAYTDSYHYPRHWSLACGMVLVGMATGCTCHVMYRAWPVRPLIHPIMIGESGAGKGAVVELMRRVRLAGLPALECVEDESTPAGLIEAIKDGEPTLITAEEMTTMFNGMDFQKNIVPIITRLADNNHYSKRLKGGNVKKIERVRCALVMGSNEKALREHFTASIIEQGLASRFLWLFSSVQDEPVDGLDETDPQVIARKNTAAEALTNLAGLTGEASPTDEARAWYRDWHVKYRNMPASDGMSGYYSRRHLLVWRCALISALSRRALAIEVADMEWAWEWVRECESQMFGIFERLGRSRWGQCEGTITDYLAARADWVNESDITRKFGAKWAGAGSVRRVLDSLVESGIVSREAAKNGGRKYMIAGAMGMDPSS